MSKFTKMNKAELIDLLEMEKRLNARHVGEYECLQELRDEDRKTIVHLSNDLNAANSQIEGYKESIDNLTTEKFEALEQVKEFKSKLINNKKRNNIIVVILFVALIIAIIL